MFQIQTYKVKKGDVQGGERPGLDDSLWDDFHRTDRWGGKDTHYWFRTSVTIPENFHGKTVVYRLETGREGQWDALNPQLLIYVNGELIQGLDVNHRETELSACALPGETYSIALYAWSGTTDGLVELRSELAVLDSETEKLYYNIKVPLEVAALLDAEDQRRINILKYLDAAVNLLDLRKPFSGDYTRTIQKANEYLENEFYGDYCDQNEITALCVGHSHIDVAWLWRLEQTRGKSRQKLFYCAKTYGRLSRICLHVSQPQLYQFVKEDYPQVYDKIRQRVREGRWNPKVPCGWRRTEISARGVFWSVRSFSEQGSLNGSLV